MKRVIILSLSLGLTCGIIYATGFPSSFYKIKKAKEQKRAFINILKPLVQKSNEKVLQERQFVSSFFNYAINSAFRELNPNDLGYLLKLAKKYKIKKIFDRKKYLKRLDIVPISLALTQGAIESGWGKSRFVRQANNIFGHWTWGEVGLVPLQRDENKTHKIRIFSSLQSSVDAYVLNLNRNYAYRDFREKRYKFHSQEKLFNGYEAAKTMLYYSELRQKYVDMLHKMMEDENLLYFDRNTQEERSTKL